MKPAVSLFAAAVAGLGALLVSGAFIYVWAPIPKAVPGREAIAVAAGALMLAAAAGLLWRKTLMPSAIAVTLLFLAWLLALQVPRIAGSPSKEILWSGFGQLVSIVAGGWMLTGRSPRAARLLYAVALPLFGIHHLTDVAQAAQAVPAWLPFRPAWVWLTAIGHIAAGVAIASGIAARLAAMLEAIMISVFVVLIHVPGVVKAPADKLQWTMLIVASAIAGAAWIVAQSYRAAEMAALTLRSPSSSSAGSGQPKPMRM